MKAIAAVELNPSVKMIETTHRPNKTSSSFKEILNQKRVDMSTPNPPSAPSSTVTNVVKDLMDNHEQATRTIKSFMTRTDYSVDKLLAIQYKTGLLFLREQMFCKTVEHSANTFKNFTQMQI